jgi:hypothetical protein
MRDLCGLLTAAERLVGAGSIVEVLDSLVLSGLLVAIDVKLIFSRAARSPLPLSVEANVLVNVEDAELKLDVRLDACNG